MTKAACAANGSRQISVAYSPDTDDAFMVQAMREGRVDLRGYDFKFVSADIQELNEAARSETYDVTAISVAAYADLASTYLMMPVGASIGDDFGPAIIVRNNSVIHSPAALKDARIAVPGLKTSAYFAANALFGPFTAVPMHFAKIGPAVAHGDVDAGILIHELQIDCERQGFKKLGDLGKLWSARFALPLPLGANAIRRSLGNQTIQDVTAVMRASIETGLATRTETLKAALAASKADLDLALGDRYISMYVNDRSLKFERDVLDAVRLLFTKGAEAGLCSPMPKDSGADSWFLQETSLDAHH